VHYFAYKDQFHIRSHTEFIDSYYIVTSSTLSVRPNYYPLLDDKVDYNFHFYVVGKDTPQLRTSPIVYSHAYCFLCRYVCFVFQHLSEEDWQAFENAHPNKYVIIPMPWMYSAQKQQLKSRCKLKNIRYFDLEKEGCISISS
jgi:hypothetical protein